eukprot:CAMPEP_0172468136 /NCGR_PEP_ID=MMETSP1065-20121228/60791_1 /TAXON_ID=265537 /ORGANISM="Amphiprora paludosa, Strain CCMP125" /LENGTH=88 /DNA_ID=CAMNT_0013225477 /DNA_START=9 /DNA_END=271 /DNA_ORIENTATION=-
MTFNLMGSCWHDDDCANTIPDVCTIGVCDNGFCLYPPKCGDDGNICNGPESCNLADGQCTSAIPNNPVCKELTTTFAGGNGSNGNMFT